MPEFIGSFAVKPTDRSESIREYQAIDDCIKTHDRLNSELLTNWRASLDFRCYSVSALYSVQRHVSDWDICNSGSIPGRQSGITKTPSREQEKDTKVNVVVPVQARPNNVRKNSNAFRRERILLSKSGKRTRALLHARSFQTNKLSFRAAETTGKKYLGRKIR